MGSDYIKQLRKADRAIGVSIEKEHFAEKVAIACQDVELKIIPLIQREIEKGISVDSAINKVLENKNILKLYKSLRNEAVRREVKNFYRNKLYKKNKQSSKNEIKAGESR